MKVVYRYTEDEMISAAKKIAEGADFRGCPYLEIPVETVRLSLPTVSEMHKPAPNHPIKKAVFRRINDKWEFKSLE